MKKTALILSLALAWSALSLNAQSVVNTVHNLSVSGPGSIRAASETEVCIFCHTPHDSRPESPLWNRQDPGVTYVLYNSSTVQAMTGQPDGSSVLCLSCHDGTIALGNVLSRTADIQMTGGVTRCLQEAGTFPLTFLMIILSRSFTTPRWPWQTVSSGILPRFSSR